jgi:hypothetical protein
MVSLAPDINPPVTAVTSPSLAARIITVLLLLGMISFAAVQSHGVEPPECGPVTIGQSAIGGCDWIAP